MARRWCVQYGLLPRAEAQAWCDEEAARKGKGKSSPSKGGKPAAAKRKPGVRAGGPTGQRWRAARLARGTAQGAGLGGCPARTSSATRPPPRCRLAHCAATASSDEDDRFQKSKPAAKKSRAPPASKASGGKRRKPASGAPQQAKAGQPLPCHAEAAGGSPEQQTGRLSAGRAVARPGAARAPSTPPVLPRAQKARAAATRTARMTSSPQSASPGRRQQGSRRRQPRRSRRRPPSWRKWARSHQQRCLRPRRPGTWLLRMAGSTTAPAATTTCRCWHGRGQANEHAPPPFR